MEKTAVTGGPQEQTDGVDMGPDMEWGGVGPRVVGPGACLRRQKFPLLRPSPSIAAVPVPWARDRHYSHQEFTPP